MKMEKEIEFKFNVPKEFENEEFLFSLKHILNSEGYIVEKPEILTRRFSYYDTPDLDLHKIGGTLRLVEGFDSVRYKCKYRYDFKFGPLNNRVEGNLWNNQLLDVNKIFLEERAGIGLRKKVRRVAIATMINYKGHLRKGRFVAEYTLDHVTVIEAGSFREMEIELKEGRKEDLNKLSEVVQNRFNLERITKQKYSRIIEMIGGKG